MRLLKAFFCLPLVASAASITFGPATSYDIGVFASSSTLLLTDLTDDNRPDMVAVCTSPEPVIVTLTNHGNGTFSLAQQYPILRHPHGAAAGDFNKDGSIDVLVTYADSFYTGTNGCLYLGDSRGAFTNRTDDFLAFAGVGDFNADEHRDLVLYTELENGTDSETVLGLRFGKGDGTFDLIITNRLSLDQLALWYSQTDVLDFNRDGKDDLLIRSAPFGIALLPSQGDGTFGRPRFLPTQKVYVYYLGYRAARYVATSILTEDVNGDGINDLITLEVDLIKQTGNGHLMAVRMGRKRGGFGLPRRYFKWSLVSVGTGDLDGDGKVDLVAGQSNQEDFVLVAQGTGRGRFASPVMVPLGVGGDQILVRDLNGDNRADLVQYRRTGGAISILLSN